MLDVSRLTLCPLSLSKREDHTMNRQFFALVVSVVFCVSGITQAAVYDDVYWVGPDGEWTGDVTANPEYSIGWWSTNPNAASGVPAKFAFGRNDGIRVGRGGWLRRIRLGSGTMQRTRLHLTADPGGPGRVPN